MGWLEKTVAGGQRFLIQQELPMSLIRTSAHRSLMTEAEQRQWLQMLLDRMQAELVARKVAPESRRARLGACGSTSASNRSITPSRRVACICTPHRDSPWDRAADGRSHVAPLPARRVTESLSARTKPRSLRGLCDQLGLERDDVERVAALGKHRQAAAPA